MAVEHEVIDNHYIRKGNAAIFGAERQGSYSELVLNDAIEIPTYQDLLDLQEIIDFAVIATQGKFP
jgi:hypothetical protein